MAKPLYVGRAPRCGVKSSSKSTELPREQRRVKECLSLPSPHHRPLGSSRSLTSVPVCTSTSLLPLAGTTTNTGSKHPSSGGVEHVSRCRTAGSRNSSPDTSFPLSSSPAPSAGRSIHEAATVFKPSARRLDSNPSRTASCSPCRPSATTTVEGRNGSPTMAITAVSRARNVRTDDDADGVAFAVASSSVGSGMVKFQDSTDEYIANGYAAVAADDDDDNVSTTTGLSQSHSSSCIVPSANSSSASGTEKKLSRNSHDGLSRSLKRSIRRSIKKFQDAL